jgi:hypothetical protein
LIPTEPTIVETSSKGSTRKVCTFPELTHDPKSLGIIDNNVGLLDLDNEVPTCSFETIKEKMAKRTSDAFIFKN